MRRTIPWSSKRAGQLVLPLVISVLLVTICGGCTLRNHARDPLRVGMDFTNPPFQMFNRMPIGTPDIKDPLHRSVDGSVYEMAGASVDIAVALANYLGRPLEIKAIKFQDLIGELQANRIDIILSTMSITEKRLAQIDFSDPYAQSGLGMLVRSKSTIKSLEDLNKPGFKAIVRLHTAGDEFMENKLPQNHRIVIEEAGLAERMVMDDPKAAYVNDQVMLWRMSRDLPDRTSLVANLLNRDTWGIGIRKGDATTRASVNAFIKSYREAGGFKKISDKYLADFQGFLSANQLPPLFP